MRSICLAVDVTNYVMLETGQPLHAFDADRLSGGIVVRRAKPGERLKTLDDVDRTLDPEDLVIADDSGPIALAGTMGGASSEVTASTTSLVIEAAHFDSVVVARESRRHKLSSEASRRFERGVDSELGPIASAMALDLLARYGERRPGGSPRSISASRCRRSRFRSSTRRAWPGRRTRTRSSWPACATSAARSTARTPTDLLTVTAPSWRPDLTDPERLRRGGDPARGVREGAVSATDRRLSRRTARRLTTSDHRSRRGFGGCGLDRDPGLSVRLAVGHRRAGPARGRRTPARGAPDQPALRRGAVPAAHLAAGTQLRRCAATSDVVSPTSRSSTFLRSSWPSPDAPKVAPRPPVTQRPSDEQIAELMALLPDQPLHVAGLIVGDAERPGWWGAGRRVEWADGVQAARTVADALRVDVTRPCCEARALAPRSVRRAVAEVRCCRRAGPASCTRGRARISGCRRGPSPSSSTSTYSAPTPQDS